MKIILRNKKFNNIKKYQYYYGFHLVTPSPWPFTAISLLSIVIGAVTFFHSFVFIIGDLLPFGLFALTFMLARWWRDVIIEGTYEGKHTSLVQGGLRLAFISFIISEVISAAAVAPFFLGGDCLLFFGFFVLTYLLARWVITEGTYKVIFILPQLFFKCYFNNFSKGNKLLSVSPLFFFDFIQERFSDIISGNFIQNIFQGLSKQEIYNGYFSFMILVFIFTFFLYFISTGKFIKMLENSFYPLWYNFFYIICAFLLIIIWNFLIYFFSYIFEYITNLLPLELVIGEDKSKHLLSHTTPRTGNIINEARPLKGVIKGQGTALEVFDKARETTRPIFNIKGQEYFGVFTKNFKDQLLHLSMFQGNFSNTADYLSYVNLTRLNRYDVDNIVNCGVSNYSNLNFSKTVFSTETVLDHFCNPEKIKKKHDLIADTVFRYLQNSEDPLCKDFLKLLANKFTDKLTFKCYETYNSIEAIEKINSHAKFTKIRLQCLIFESKLPKQDFDKAFISDMLKFLDPQNFFRGQGNTTEQFYDVGAVVDYKILTADIQKLLKTNIEIGCAIEDINLEEIFSSNSTNINSKNLSNINK